jgi:hypothetical protein
MYLAALPTLPSPEDKGVAGNDWATGEGWL